MTTETEPTQEERNAAATAIIHAQGWHDDETETLDPETYDATRYDAGAAEFLVLTDDEADTLAAADIKKSLWAFNADFLAGYMPEGIDAEEINAIRGERCEGANSAMLALVGDRLEEVTEEAIAADGRGHFLSGYDGDEIEQEHGGRLWYAYRTN